MKPNPLVLAGLLLLAPVALAHNPPAPVTTCQPAAGQAYHDYIPPVQLETRTPWWDDRRLADIGRDGNLEECGITTEYLQVLSDNNARCQDLKHFRDNDPDPAVRQAASELHILLCTYHTVFADRTADYDGELDYGHGGVVLAVNGGDGATWGSEVCFGMDGHHTRNIYALGWPNGVGPAFSVAADYSRTPPAPGPKSPRTDCGDGFLEPCTDRPERSGLVWPVGPVVDAVGDVLWALMNEPRVTCNPLDCAEHNAPVAPATTRSNPFGATHLYTSCNSGVDGVLVVFIEPDLDAPDAPQLGHIWTS